MKGSWRLIVAVIILGGLIVYLRLPAKKPAADTAPPVAKFQPAQATRIQISQPGEPQVILDRKGKQWRIEQPYIAAADSNQVTTLLSTASSMVPTEKLGPEKNLADFGLDQPATVEITLQPGHQYAFQFGSATPTSGDLYLKLASAADVYTVPTYTKSDLIQTAFNLRDKSILHFSPDRLTSLRLNYHGRQIGFARQQGKWPKSEATTIQTLLDALSNAEMDAVTDPAGKDAARYGLTHPDITVVLGWKGGEAKLEIGDKTGSSEYYARSSASPAIFTMNGYLLGDVSALAQPAKKPAARAAAGGKKSGAGKR